VNSGTAEPFLSIKFYVRLDVDNCININFDDKWNDTKVSGAVQ